MSVEVVVSAPVLNESGRDGKMRAQLISQKLAECVELGNLINTKYAKSMDENLEEEKRRELRNECYELNRKRKTAKVDAELLMIEVQKNVGGGVAQSTAE